MQSIYPMLIIILVALERSYCDRHFIHDLPPHKSVQPVSVSIVVDIERSTDTQSIPLSQALDGSDSRVNLQTKEKRPQGMVQINPDKET
ncbi:hypothetical protein PENSPDRAFT_146443 [Peniophora sp. CONT]|nr:hypothetical protein PENSPDRAFT_146443 [Peniophora sp. CONT]